MSNNGGGSCKAIDWEQTGRAGVSGSVIARSLSYCGTVMTRVTGFRPRNTVKMVE